MKVPERPSHPQAVLFACGMNAVRSPMAAGLLQQMFGTTVYVGSAGVQKGELDPFAVVAMEEIGIDISRHKPSTAAVVRPTAKGREQFLPWTAVDRDGTLAICYFDRRRDPENNGRDTSL